MKKTTYPQVISELDRIASKKAGLSVKRTMADADRYDPPTPKPERKARQKSVGIDRFVSGGLTSLMDEAGRHLKAVDPRTEWETGVAVLREEYHAIRNPTTSKSKPRAGASRRSGSR